jgi:hypothetical protein
MSGTNSISMSDEYSLDHVDGETHKNVTGSNMNIFNSLKEFERSGSKDKSIIMR